MSAQPPSPDWPGHRPGQHVDVRLTAAESYFIASPPERPGIELVVERLDDGEVSPYLTDVLRTGGLLELRGPVGGYFVWPTGTDGPVQLIADAPALVVRCPNCAGVVLRYASSGSRLRLDLTGARLLTVTLPANGSVEGIGRHHQGLAWPRSTCNLDSTSGQTRSLKAPSRRYVFQRRRFGPSVGARPAE